jgi:hypothetical protein
MKEQIQKYAKKHIKCACYLKVTLGHRGLKGLATYWLIKQTINEMNAFRQTIRLDKHQVPLG